MNEQRLTQLSNVLKGADPTKEIVLKDDVGGRDRGPLLPVDGPGPVGFNMRFWSDSDGCGTLCCIGGLTRILFENVPLNEATQSMEEILDLTSSEVTALTMPIIGWSRITPAAAAYVIDNLIKTGKVDWHCLPEELKP